MYVNTTYKNCIGKLSNCFQTHPTFHLLCITLNTTPSWNLQMVVYLNLVEVWGHENSGRVFLCLVSNINVSVTASCVMRKWQTDVFTSVFCDARESMEFRHNEGLLLDNAVSLYFLRIYRFTLVWEAKVFKCNVRNIHSVPPKLCIFFVLQISYTPIYTMFLL